MCDRRTDRQTGGHYIFRQHCPRYAYITRAKPEIGCSCSLVISKCHTLYDELRQQESKKDGVSEADETAADLDLHHRAATSRLNSHVYDRFDPDKLLPSAAMNVDG